RGDRGRADGRGAGAQRNPRRAQQRALRAHPRRRVDRRDAWAAARPATDRARPAGHRPAQLPAGGLAAAAVRMTGLNRSAILLPIAAVVTAMAAFQVSAAFAK